MAAVVAVNGRAAARSQANLESKVGKDTRVLTAHRCKNFYTLGQVSGTCGSITVKAQDDSVFKSHQRMLVSTSGVQKKRMEEGMYVLGANGVVLSSPSPRTCPLRPPRSSDRAPLFQEAECYLSLFDTSIKRHQLGVDRSILSCGLIQNPKGFSGRSQSLIPVAKAGTKGSNDKTQPLPRCILLDIEGTTTPISFVFDVLFPYARENVGKHLAATYETAKTQDDIKLLRSQVESDLSQGVDGSVPIPADDLGKEEVIAALVANVEAMIRADRKLTALKQLQGHIWRTGFENNELEGVVFDDVPEALERWNGLGIKVFIYSSGSRLAQRLIFGKTNHGDLRKYLSGFFDTAVGNKREERSYVEISESLGVDKPNEILFVTDVIPEAIAAKAAGLEVLISVRPGNAPLPANHGFKTINSFSEILKLTCTP